MFDRASNREQIYAVVYGQVAELAGLPRQARQRTRLEAEGIRFGADGRIALDGYRWQPS